jgi:hypothetical protein
VEYRFKILVVAVKGTDAVSMNLTLDIHLNSILSGTRFIQS